MKSAEVKNFMIRTENFTIDASGSLLKTGFVRVGSTNMLAAFSQCLAAMLLITYAHALTFSMNRTEHAFSAKPAALGSAIPMNGGYLNMGLYYITIGLGTPQQMVNLHVDTGSSTLGVYASDCASCASSNVLYSMTASSTSSGRRDVSPLEAFHNVVSFSFSTHPFSSFSVGV
jgi:hypothetical protein